MKFRSMFLAAALMAAAITSLGSVQAGTIVVTDSGDIGGFIATNEGVSGNTATIQFAAPSITSQLNTVNGAFITPEPTAILGPITLTVTVTSLGAETYNVALVPPVAQQVIGGTVGSQAIENFNLQSGVAPSVLPAFFNITGTILGLAANANPNLDFTPFEKTGIQNFTLTTNTFENLAGAQSWAHFFQTAGAVAVGNGSFSQQAVPEPASLGMLGVGMSGLFLFRRIFRKRSR